jgi:hypothetical protein
MKVTRERQPQRALLAASLSFCPVVLFLAVATLPRFTWLYGGFAERVLYLVLLSLPFVGVAGIARFTGTTRWVKWLCALAYLAVTVVLVALAAIFIGCSLAKACF